MVVVGAGQMGAGIAQVAAEAGLDVVMSDVDEEAAKRGLRTIVKNLGRGVERGRLTEADKETVLARVKLSTSLQALGEFDIVIEASVERMDVKLGVFRELDQVAPGHAVLASNTSSLSITALAAATSRPERVIGMHFMNPVPAMRLVEVVRGLQTADQTCEAVHQLAKRLGKTPADVSDTPGFAINRVLIPMINEAIFCVQEGVASPEGIDLVMTLGANHPLGPLALADLIGLDTCLAVMEVLHEGLGDPKYRPCPLLRKYVEAGWLGRKSGRGFHRYGSEP